jgi:hypothetical protein
MLVSDADENEDGVFNPLYLSEEALWNEKDFWKRIDIFGEMSDKIKISII